MDEYEVWLAELADLLHCSSEELEESYSQLRPLLYDGGMSPSEAADALRMGM